jgi:hypothetical protein
MSVCLPTGFIPYCTLSYFDANARTLMLHVTYSNACHVTYSNACHVTYSNACHVTYSNACHVTYSHAPFHDLQPRTLS